MSREIIHQGNFEVGRNVVFYSKVEIGDGTRIFDNAVIGRPPIPTQNLTRPVDTSFRPLKIGKDCVIGANSVIYTGVEIGNRVLIGDLTRIREGCAFADDVVIGGGVLVMYDTKVGTRTKVIDGTILTGNMIIEEDVFIGPGVDCINDNRTYATRFSIEPWQPEGPTIKRFAFIGGGAKLSAGITIGEGALVAPGAMVTRDVEPWTVVLGVPAKKARDVDPLTRKKILNLFGLEDA